MGLGASRKRFKLSHDPNNTTWSRSTVNYGHKILTSHGWSPGSFLGAPNAPHAHLHTDANASHVRVSMKDDNLGIGAKHDCGQEGGRTTGLDMFQDILGRLNGKTTDELEKEQLTRDDLIRTYWTDQRWGTLKFVSGGLLVGDTMQDTLQKEVLKADTTRLAVDAVGQPSLELKNCKIQELASGSDLEMKKLAKKSTKKAKQRQKEEKLLRRVKKEKKQESNGGARETTKEDASSLKIESTELDSESGRTKIGAIHSQQVNDSHGFRSTQFTDGRHAVRQRYIRQKQLASMDTKALNEVGAKRATNHDQKLCANQFPRF